MTGDKKTRAGNSLDKLSNGIHYIQAAIAAISGLLLLLGLVTATTNLLTKDWLFGSWPWLQYAWAFAQAIAVDANLAVVGMLFFSAIDDRDKVKIIVYSLIGGMLLFVAAVIMDIESVRQALDITLAEASLKVHVSLEVLTLVRGAIVVLLVFMSGRSTINLFSGAKPKGPEWSTHTADETPPEVVAQPPDPVQPLSSVSVAPARKQARTNHSGQKGTASNGHGNTYQRYLATVTKNPNATAKWLAQELGVSQSSIQLYRRQARNKDSSNNEHDELEVFHATPEEANV